MKQVKFCPFCGSQEVEEHERQEVLHCHACRSIFTVTEAAH